MNMYNHFGAAVTIELCGPNWGTGISKIANSELAYLCHGTWNTLSAPNLDVLNKTSKFGKENL